MALSLSNPVRQKLLGGHVSIGSWCVSGDPLSAEVLAGEGFEWIVVDMEHYPIDAERAANCFRAAQLAGAVPVARLPACDPVWIKRTLDAGALGIIVPLLRSADDARHVAEWSRFPPLGRRPFGGGRAAFLYGDAYLAQANAAILVMVQIETAQAVAELDAILAVEGIDGCFVGPTDLALSLGLPVPPARDARREELVATLAKRIRAAGRVAGTVSGSSEAAAARLAEGYGMVSIGSDLAHMRGSARAALAEMRKRGGGV